MILNQILAIKGERFCFEITINQPVWWSTGREQLDIFLYCSRSHDAGALIKTTDYLIL